MRITCTEAEKIRLRNMDNQSDVCLFDNCDGYDGKCKECFENRIEWEITDECGKAQSS